MKLEQRPPARSSDRHRQLLHEHIVAHSGASNGIFLRDEFNRQAFATLIENISLCDYFEAINWKVGIKLADRQHLCGLDHHSPIADDRMQNEL